MLRSTPLRLLCLLGSAAGLALVQRAALSPVPSARRAPAPLAQEGVASPCVIKVVGVGGGGGNAVNRMIQFGQAQTGAVEYWALNTDIQALDASLSPNRLGLGAGTSRGLGAGGSPDTGAASAKESYEQISQMVAGSDMVFVVAGMGGGTGSGGAPIVAEAAKSAGALTVAVVTKPFSFEGQRRMRQAEEAIAKLKQHVDAMIVVSNDRLLDLVEEGTPLQEAFCVADDILRQVCATPQGVSLSISLRAHPGADMSAGDIDVGAHSPEHEATGDISVRCSGDCCRACVSIGRGVLSQ